jgi:hypothetical protein
LIVTNIIFEGNFISTRNWSIKNVLILKSNEDAFKKIFFLLLAEDEDFTVLFWVASSDRTCICRIEGAGTVKESTCRRWFAKFLNREEGFKDKNRSGRKSPSSIVVELSFWDKNGGSH